MTRSQRADAINASAAALIVFLTVLSAIVA
jgi:hypothetical protein